MCHFVSWLTLLSNPCCLLSKQFVEMLLNCRRCMSMIGDHSMYFVCFFLLRILRSNLLQSPVCLVFWHKLRNSSFKSLILQCFLRPRTSKTVYSYLLCFLNNFAWFESMTYSYPYVSIFRFLRIWREKWGPWAVNSKVPFLPKFTKLWCLDM